MNFSIIGLVIKVLFLLVLLVAGAWLGEQITDDPGFMIMSFAGYRIEMAGWLALVLVLVTWILVYVLFSLLSNWRIDRRLMSWRSGRKRGNAERQLQQGLSQLGRGDFKSAHSLFKKSAANSSMPAVSYLLAAFAAHAYGKSEECDQWLRKAEQQPGVDPILSGLLQAMVQLERGHYEQALASLNRLPDQEKNPFRQDLLRKIYLQLGDWKQLADVIKAIKKRPGKVSDTVIQAEKQQTLHQIGDMGVDALQAFWKQLDTSVKQDPEIMLAVSSAFVKGQHADWAEQLLANHMAPAFQPELVLAYGRLPADASKQLMVAERWLRERPNDSVLFVTLGRLSLKATLWGKAEEYFEMAIALSEHPMAHAELARHYGNTDRIADSIRHYEKSMAAGYQLPATDIPKKDA
jgi:HemY protein